MIFRLSWQQETTAGHASVTVTVEAAWPIAGLQVVCGCFYRRKPPENTKFATASSIFDARENRSGASDKATRRGRGVGGGSE